MKRYLITITGRANLGYKGNRLRERDLCCAYVYGMNKAEAISKFWEQIEKSSGLKGFERRDFKLTAERWEKEADLDVHGNPLKDLEWAIPFDLLSSVEMEWDNHSQNYKLAVPKSIMAMAEASEDVEQAKAERIHDQILETAQESKNAWEISVFFSKDQILRELNQLKTDLGSGHVVGCTERHEHQMNRYIKALEIAIIQLMASEKPLMPHLDAGKEIIKEISTEATESNLEAQNASSAVEFERVSDYLIKASWKGEMIGKISISYKNYTPVIKVYRVNGNMDEKFDSLDDAKMHLIQNFRAQAQEALDQAVDEKTKLNLRNKIDALDDQIADLFIKGAEMRTGKEA